MLHLVRNRVDNIIILHLSAKIVDHLLSLPADTDEIFEEVHRVFVELVTQKAAHALFALMSGVHARHAWLRLVHDDGVLDGFDDSRDV